MDGVTIVHLEAVLRYGVEINSAGIVAIFIRFSYENSHRIVDETERNGSQLNGICISMEMTN